MSPYPEKAPEYRLIDTEGVTFKTRKGAINFVTEKSRDNPELFNGKTLALLSESSTFEVELKPRTVVDVLIK